MSEVSVNETLTNCPQCGGPVIIIPGVYFPAQLICSQCGLDLHAWFGPNRSLLERARKFHFKLLKITGEYEAPTPIGNVIFYVNGSQGTGMGSNCSEISPPFSTDNRFLKKDFPLRDFSEQLRPSGSEPPFSVAPDPSDAENAGLFLLSVVDSPEAVRSSLPDLPAPFALLCPEEVKKLMIGDHPGEESAISKNNKECPFCGMPANPRIKACETGLSYCSDRCATLHVKSLGGGW